MKLSITELLNSTSGRLIKGSSKTDLVCISTDTRTISGDDIFLPLIGTNFDGHNYLDVAVSKGCKGYFVDKNHSIGELDTEFIIQVDDTLAAYLKIAKHVREKYNPVVVAVTGSSGKTTTKEFIYSVLETAFVTHKSALNHNNEIGLCQTLLSMPENCEYIVLEMGMRGPGEISLLSAHSSPDIAVITNVGSAHIGRLGSIDNIARAKCEIADYLRPNGVLFAFEDELTEKYCNFQGRKIFLQHKYEIINRDENSVKFCYGKKNYTIPTSEKYNITNSVFAIEIGNYSGISPENIKKGLLGYSAVGERGKIVSFDNNIKFILDCYNANPESVISSVDSFTGSYNEYKKVLVLGDMAELGEYEQEKHREIGRYLQDKPVDLLVTVGKKAALIAESAGGKVNSKPFLNNKEAAAFLKNYMVENTVILLKGSRCMKLEEIMEFIY